MRQDDRAPGPADAAIMVAMAPASRRVLQVPLQARREAQAARAVAMSSPPVAVERQLRRQPRGVGRQNRAGRTKA